MTLLYFEDCPNWLVANEHLATLEEQLKLALGTKIDLRQTAKGRGRLTIHFKTNDEFERIKAILCGETVADGPAEIHGTG